MSDSEREGERFTGFFSQDKSGHTAVSTCVCVCVSICVSLLHTQTAAKYIQELVLATLLERHILSEDVAAGAGGLEKWA